MNLKEIIIEDVRMPYEYENGHVKGAVNIPLQEIPQRLEEFKNMKPTCFTNTNTTLIKLAICGLHHTVEN